MNREQVSRNASGVFRSPNPWTTSPSSRSLWASRVKSLSEVTRQNPSSRPLCMRSIASITSAMSAAFLPVVLLRCWCCRIAID